MPGDWIQMRVWLARDPKVLWMADTLASQRCFMNWLTNPVHRHCDESAYEHVTRDVLVTVCVTGLLQVWGVAREQGYREEDDLLVTRCDIEAVSAIAGVPGFGQSMADVGWLIEERKGIARFPKFFEQKRSPSDRFAISGAERQRAYRERLRNKGRDTVTETLHSGDVTRDEKVTKSDARVEKRRDREEETKARDFERSREIDSKESERARPRLKKTGEGNGGFPAGLDAESPFVRLYWTKYHLIPTIRSQELIVQKVQNLTVWGEVLDYWQANDHRPQSVGKMLDRYGRLERGEINENGHGKPAAEPYKPDASMDLDKIYPNLRKGGE